MVYVVAAAGVAVIIGVDYLFAYIDAFLTFPLLIIGLPVLFVLWKLDIITEVSMINTHSPTFLERWFQRIVGHSFYRSLLL